MTGISLHPLKGKGRFGGFSGPLGFSVPLVLLVFLSSFVRENVFDSCM